MLEFELPSFIIWIRGGPSDFVELISEIQSS